MTGVDRRNDAPLVPAEIAMRQFSRTLFGADPGEVRRFLSEAAGTLERVHGELAGVILERTTLQATLKKTSAQVEALQEQLAAAHEKIASYQGQESVVAQALLTAQKAAEDVTREGQAQAARVIAEANAAAEETVQSARNAAADLLRAARARAQQAIEAADRAAAARLGAVQIEAERMVEEAHSAAVVAERAARQQIEQFCAALEGFVATREELSQHLEGLLRQQADSLDVMGRMHAEVTEAILPALRDLRRTFTEKAGASALPATPSFPEGPVPPVAPRHPAEAPRPSPADDGAGAPAPAPRPAGEIVISPIHSYLEATKLVTAVARTAGVKRARLRTYSKGAVIIDVATDPGTLEAVRQRLVEGFPLDVVEATDRRLVLRLAPNAGPRPSPLAGSLLG